MVWNIGFLYCWILLSSEYTISSQWLDETVLSLLLFEDRTFPTFFQQDGTLRANRSEVPRYPVSKRWIGRSGSHVKSYFFSTSFYFYIFQIKITYNNSL